MFLDVLIEVVLGGQPLEPLLPFILSWLVAITVGLTVHEFAHAKRADMAGDPTPRNNGRVSLNPLDHYDPIGTTFILLFGMGWGKPVPVNPLNFRNRRRDAIMVGAWGPLSNIIVATLAGLPIRFGIAGEYTLPLAVMVMLNLLLAIFNLLPLGPLDGAGVVEGLLPRRKAIRFSEFTNRYGMVLLFLIILIHPLGNILILTPMQLLGRVITGHNLLTLISLAAL
ncbi:MAG: site-2 protease family protein [Armatimonadota bacterium]